MIEKEISINSWIPGGKAITTSSATIKPSLLQAKKETNFRKNIFCF